MTTKRRRNKEGALFQRRDGRWVARLSHEGKRITVYGKTAAEATKKLNDLKVKRHQGEPLVMSQIPLGEYLAQWIASIKPQVRPSTYAGHETTTRVHLIPRLGHIKLSKLEPADIDKAYAAMLAEGTSPSMIQHAHLRLSKALNDALRRKLIYRNPCQIVTPPRVTRKELRPPDADAIHRILEAAKGKEYYELFFIAFHTGLRRNETLALQWRDVDLDMGTISVNRNIYHAKGSQTHYHEPKTAKGRRLVSLTPSSILVLRALRERQQADAATFSYQVTDDSPVFRYRDGLRMLPRAVSGAFKKLVRKLGMDGFNFHTTRHAHATLMLRQGVHPSIVQSRLGHSRVSTTLDIYSHILPGLQEAAALRFEEGLMAAKKPEQAKEPVTG